MSVLFERLEALRATLDKAELTTGKHDRDMRRISNRLLRESIKTIDAGVERPLYEGSRAGYWVRE